MLQKMDALLLSVRLAGTRFLRSLKQDERGLSGVVVAVLLILVAVLAVVALWGFLEDWIQDMWDRITKENTI